MEVRIGVRENGAALSFESTMNPKELSATIAEAISKNAPLVELTDAKGKTILIPTSSISFVEIGADNSRRVGFIA